MAHKNKGVRHRKPKARRARSTPVDVFDPNFVLAPGFHPSGRTWEDVVDAANVKHSQRTLGGPSDSHYASLKGAQPVEIMEDWQLPAHLHSVLKYIARYRTKGGVEDLEKAKWWLDRYINHVNETGKF